MKDRLNLWMKTTLRDIQRKPSVGKTLQTSYCDILSSYIDKEAMIFLTKISLIRHSGEDIPDKVYILLMQQGLAMSDHCR